jgi:hypothetical protein
MQWFYPRDYKPENFRKRLAMLKLSLVLNAVFVAVLVGVWALDLAILGGLEHLDFFGIQPVLWVVLLPIVMSYLPAKKDPKPWNPREAALFFLAFGGLLGLMAAAISSARWPLWPVSAVLVGALLTSTLVPLSMWFHSRNPYQDGPAVY